MVHFIVAAHTAEIRTEMELLREILHAVIKVRGKHHFQFLRVDLTVLVHHEIRCARGLKVESVVRAVGVAESQEMAEFMGALLLECMAVTVLTDRRNARVFS